MAQSLLLNLLCRKRLCVPLITYTWCFVMVQQAFSCDVAEEMVRLAGNFL
jgi:hypothetical protein